MAELIALLLAGLGSMLAQGQGEAALAAALEKSLRQSEAVDFEDVEVSCSGVSTAGVEHLSLELEGLLMDPLVIERAEIVVSGLSLKAGRITMQDIEWDAKISEAALSSALAGHANELGDSSISIDEKSLRLSGTYPFLRARLPYSVAGRIAVEQGTQLMFRIDQSKAAGIGIPAQLNRMIESEINPVYDLADFAERSEKDIRRAREQFSYDFALSVETISNAKGHIIVSGKA